MSKWQIQVDKLLAEYEGITDERYAAGLAYVPSSGMCKATPMSRMPSEAHR